jgi:hypothetical protein
MSAPLGFIAYEGPSEIDGAPIVVIVTTGASANSKTGDMVQTWVLRADVHPQDALASGADASVCGDCEHRPILAAQTGAARCYVNVSRAPASVWRAYRRGRYQRAPLAVIARSIAGRVLRIGTYGDPAAAPLATWRALVVYVAGWTGYSHQWRTLGPEWGLYVMASADRPEDRTDARARGFRSFRVSTDPTDRVAGAEAVCPASAEGGRRATCTTCQLCAGRQVAARDIVILDHGPGWQRRRTISIATEATA